MSTQEPPTALTLEQGAAPLRVPQTVARYYLAASYSQRLEMEAVAAVIRTNGHGVVSTWHDGHHERRGSHDGSEAGGEPDLSERALWAKEDIYDLEQATVVLSFTEAPGGGRRRGGRHVEYGMGLARRVVLYVVGPQEHVFHALADGTFPDFTAFCRAMGWQP